LWPGFSVSAPVHPHACGDDVADFVRDVGRERFTPTRVGTTEGCGRRPPDITVHPHACGDDWMLRFHGEAPGGSPPRVWGRRMEASFTSAM